MELWRIRYESGREELCICRTYADAIAYAETRNDALSGSYIINRVEDDEEGEKE